MKTTLILLAIHFLADQVLQSRSVQVAKHKVPIMLIAHVVTWMLLMMFFGVLTCVKINGNALCLVVAFPVSSALIHLLVEFFTGRWAESELYKGDEESYVLILFFEHLLIMVSTAFLFQHFTYQI